jgi:hypothetical protein
MGLSIQSQDDVLNWFRGRVFPVPPQLLWIGMHSTLATSGSDELSDLLGGRIAVAGRDFSEPMDDPDGLRIIVNNIAILSQPSKEQVDIVSVGLWTDERHGQLRMSAVSDPPLTVGRGDPAVFLKGTLQLRATA